MALFYRLLPKFSDFINSDDCIEKITSKSIRLQPDFIFKILKLIKKLIIFSEKMRNSSNCIYDCGHSFFGEDFQSNALYGCLILLNSGYGFSWCAIITKSMELVESMNASRLPKSYTCFFTSNYGKYLLSRYAVYTV